MNGKLNVVWMSIVGLIAAALFCLCAGEAFAGEPCDPAWQPFTSGGQIGVDFTVRALTAWNGDLVAGGDFTTAGGQTVNRIARWDGCPPTPDCPGDLTGSASVGVPDLLDLLAHWGPCPG